MNRRAFIVAAGTTLFAGCSEINSDDNDEESNDEPQQVESVPAEVKTLQPLAKDLKVEVSAHYDSARVFITSDGNELALDYVSSQESTDAVETELYQLADLYADVVINGDHDPTTLSIITSQVQAIVTEPALAAYVDDDLEQDAFFRTIEVMPIERRDN
ncbi:hypothetical protein C482_01680 [Natrialba chahannaoensis JCM 10990]|uniref:Uncharacterized protein n=1 Tax=Natrialba chahannaoensis JCM 10990 TaxID=1227492 RepID=M0B892_9EURY|nr:hypothetical protein [Natrialba chahannaoensis]ELZ06488.1 hypothetical protein C482_01680 [Natrialba chahannaoensis JCM 10990]